MSKLNDQFQDAVGELVEAGGLARFIFNTYVETHGLNMALAEYVDTLKNGTRAGTQWAVEQEALIDQWRHATATDQKKLILAQFKDWASAQSA